MKVNESDETGMDALRGWPMLMLVLAVMAAAVLMILGGGTALH